MVVGAKGAGVGAALGKMPGAVGKGSGAVAAAVLRAAAQVQSSAQADKIIKGATHAAQFGESLLVSGPPTAVTLQALAGAWARRLVEKFQKWQDSRKID